MIERIKKLREQAVETDKELQRDLHKELRNSGSAIENLGLTLKDGNYSGREVEQLFKAIERELQTARDRSRTIVANINRQRWFEEAYYRLLEVCENE